jgi:hypothetical protein
VSFAKEVRPLNLALGVGKGLIMRLPSSVLARIKRDYAEASHKEVEAMLSTYGEEPFQKEQERVLLYLLELSRGDVEKVAELLEYAKRDYRDIILWAENPSESRLDTPEKVEAFNKMLKRFGAKWQIPNESNDT